jgi:hypothetical protein
MNMPSPTIARSSVFSLDSYDPCVNCWVMPLRRVPWPAIILVDCVGDEAKISPNCALLRLKPTEPALAILFEMTDISVWAPLRPESDV